MARRICILWIMLFSHVYGEAAHSLVAGVGLGTVAGALQAAQGQTLFSGSSIILSKEV